MSDFVDNEEKLLDLWLPHILPVAGAGEVRNPPADQTFVLTGWRGAGWHMVFLDDLEQ